MVTVVVRGHQTSERDIVESVRSLLTDPYGAVRVVITLPDDHPAFQRLHNSFYGDLRVRIGGADDPLEGASLLLELVPGVQIDRGAIGRLVSALGPSSVLVVELGDGTRLPFYRAANRQSASGPAYAERAIVGTEVGLRRRTPPVLRAPKLASSHPLGRLLSEVSTIRSVPDAIRFARWISSRARSRLLSGRVKTKLPAEAPATLGNPRTASPARAPLPLRHGFQVRCPGNRWDFVAVPELGCWSPTRTVSVIVPYYRRPAELARTLAALGVQSYPASLTEILIADDGSDPPASAPQEINGVPVRVAWQPDHGFRLAAVRDLGAREARGEILIFLDCDMVPTRQWIEAHARWHHAVEDALSFGLRTHVEFDGLTAEQTADAVRNDAVGALLDGRASESPAWITAQIARTDKLRSDGEDLFRVASGGNLGVRRDFYFAIGGQDTTFEGWGGEDIEFAYRAFSQGALIVPESQAKCWHQGIDGASPRASQREAAATQRLRLASQIPHPVLRTPEYGRTYSVPTLVIRIPCEGAEPESVCAAVSDVLNGGFYDLRVVIDATADHLAHPRLQRVAEVDPRLVIGADIDDLIAIPAARIRLTLPPIVALESNALQRALRALGGAGVMDVRVGDFDITFFKTRAWHRARRATDGDVIACARMLFPHQVIASGASIGFFERAAKHAIRDRFP